MTCLVGTEKGRLYKTKSGFENPSCKFTQGPSFPPWKAPLPLVPQLFRSSHLQHACCSAVSCSACKSHPREQSYLPAIAITHYWRVSGDACSRLLGICKCPWGAQGPRGLLGPCTPLGDQQAGDLQMSPPASTSHVSSAPTVCESQGELLKDASVAPSALCSDLSYQRPTTHGPCARACPYVCALVSSSTFPKEVGTNMRLS